MKRASIETIRLIDSKCSTRFANYIVNNAGLKGKSYQLWFLIRGLANKDGFCHAGQKYMAKELKISVRWVKVLIRRLAEQGFIYSDGRTAKGVDKIYLCVSRSLMKRYQRSLERRKVQRTQIINEEDNAQYKIGELVLKSSRYKRQRRSFPGWNKPVLEPYPATRSS